LRIAQVAPLFESVPPHLYGGTELVVSYLTEELVRMGHEVTLFASGDSVTRARLVPACPRSLRLDAHCVDQLAYHVLMLEKVYARAREFDIIHFHCDYIHFPVTRREKVPNVTTLHGRLDIPELVPMYTEYLEMPVVSISDEQRRPLPMANWQATVYHGLPADAYRFNPEPGAYLAFLGRMSKEKRVDRAIAIAEKVGMPLKIAAKVDPAEAEFFETRVQPLLDHPLIEFVGEISSAEKSDFLGNAYALLFPIDWPEPFGLVMVEAMACGTPVIAYGHGSVPEVLIDGETGFIVCDKAHAVRAVHHIPEIDRARCRAHFEERFTADRMARDYMSVYKTILGPTEAVITAGQGDTAHAGRGLLHSRDLVPRRRAYAGPEAR
jgi:glycosyltransferase involved in cell wall biosynthesis